MSHTPEASLRPRRGALVAVLAVLGLALALGACADARLPATPTGPNASLANGPPFTVSIHVPRDTLLVGQSTQLTAALLNPGPDTVFGRQEVAWSTSDTAIVKVDGTGLAMAVGPGTATVTARFASWDRAGTVSITSLAATLRNAAMLKGMRIGVGVDYQVGAFPNNPPYVDVMNREFNALVPVNVLKWGVLRRFGYDSWRFQFADSILQNATTHGQMMRGHTLTWYYQNPPWLDTLQAASVSRDSAIHLLTDHIDRVLGHYRGRIKQWDVVNQAMADGFSGQRRPAWQSVWERLIGPDYVDIAFQQAARADPGALLYFADYGLGWPNARQDSAYALAAGLLAKGIRVDGVVFQGYYRLGQAATLSQLGPSMARFGALGLRVDVEAEIQLPTTSPTQAQLAEQAAEYRQIVQACDVAPNCDTVWFWAPADGPTTASWLFDASFNRKPAWYAVYNYLAGQ